MRDAYEALKRGWGGYAAYDGWFAQGPNNASLAAVGLYSQKVPEFHALLIAEGGDLPRFYAQVKELAQLTHGGRETALAAYAAASSSPGGRRRCDQPGPLLPHAVNPLSCLRDSGYNHQVPCLTRRRRAGRRQHGNAKPRESRRCRFRR